MTKLIHPLQLLLSGSQRLRPAVPLALARWLAAVWLALMCGTADAQTYTKSTTTYSWDSVGTDTGLYSDDTSSGLINIGFSFPIGGTNYSSLYLNTNGLVNFTTASNSLSNASPPTANAPYPALMVFWDDLHSGYGGSSITYGTLGTAPNRRFVISYNNVAQYANSGYRYTFQVALFETGNIEYRYQSMACCVASASVGLQVSASDFTSHGEVTTMSGNTAIAFVSTGLMAQYHNNTTLSSPAMSRVDQTVNFNWGTGSPGPGVNADNFSVHWSGSILAPTTGMYTFQTYSDDGVRLWVNGQQIINNWTVHGATYDNSTSVYLVAGTRYPIEMDMYEAGGWAVAVLNWQRPGDAAFSVIPTGNGTQGLYPYPVSVVADPGIWKGAVWWSRAGSSAAADNGGMGSWTNEVDSSKPLTGSATQPRLRNNNAQNINFNPVVEYTSTGNTASTAQYFSAPSFMGTGTVNQSHVYTVGYATASAATYLFSEGSYNARASTHQPWSDGGVHWISGYWGGDGRVVSSAIANSAPLLMSFNKDALTQGMPRTGNMSLAINGSLVASRVGSSSFTGNNTPMTLGWTTVESLSSWRGVLAEGVYFLNAGISSTQARQIESYLSVKYGITLGGPASVSDSYLHSGGGTIWTASTGYHNNIVGLGRDDTTKLNQLISRSVNSGDQITVTTGTAMPSSASVINATTGGVALASDRSFVLIGDNGQSATGTVGITVGAQAGRTRSARIWRLQMTGTVPTQLSICIPDTLLPSGFTAGAWATDLWLSTATAPDFSTGTAAATMTAATCVASGVGVNAAVSGRIATISNTVLNGMGGVGYFTVTRKLLDHIEVSASSNTGVTCAPTSYTIKACGDAACSSLYTGGLTGTLTLTGAGVTTLFPLGAGFSIGSGSSSTTLSAQVTSVSTATVGLTGLSLTPANAVPVWCGLGSPAASGGSCAMTVGSAGFQFSVANHYAGATPTVSIKAVRSSDNAQVCVPAFANVTRTIKATCGYVNPSSGTLPVQVGTAKLNAGNTNTACDATGQNVSLAFDATGATTTTAQYWDAGRMQLSLSYTGSAANNDAGLSMAGSAQFIAAPMGFIITDYPNVVTAGSNFSFNIKALAFGSNTNVMPNFGRESVPEGVTLGWLRSNPLGAGTQAGSFSATVGAFSAGVAAVSNASWSEVGHISPTARLASDSYLGSGLTAAGSPIGVMGNAYCADRNGTCVLPSGVTSTLYFGSGVNALLKSNQSGSVSCTAAYLGEPLSGIGGACYQIHTSGAGAVTTHIQVVPARLEVSTSPSCGSFSYAGQPFGATVTAKNALGTVTQNYAGTAARAVSFSDASANTSGSLAGSLAASAFSLGSATLSSASATAPVFSFSSKLTAPQTISLRATDADGVSSSGYDGSMTLRSGRLQMSNAFGGDKTSLQVPLQLQYWSGKSWVPNGADTCTVIPTASVVRARTLNHNNTAAGWSSAVSSVSLSGGSGVITLAAPSPSGTGTVDLALNLGQGSSDNSCNNVNGSATGAGVPWLRSRQGSCASTHDRDPSARATFGVYAPETQRTVHVREVF